MIKLAFIDVETKRTIHRINKTELIFFVKGNEIDNCLVNIITGRKRNEET